MFFVYLLCFKQIILENLIAFFAADFNERFGDSADFTWSFLFDKKPAKSKFGQKEPKHAKAIG